MSLMIKLTIQYSGAPFSGYELQPGQPTIRQEIASALKRVYKKPVKFYASSRTDSGVHALANVISFKPPFEIPLKKIADAINCFLPLEIRVVKVQKAGKQFNARFDARSKEYEYLIYNDKTLNPLFLPFVWHIKAKLDIKAMKKAAKFLVGKHDFSSFCASEKSDKNHNKKIHKIVICHSSLAIYSTKNVKCISIRVIGNSFLHKMVRIIVGTLVDVGLDKIDPKAMPEVLVARKRQASGRTAPAQGLCLLKVNF